MERFQKYYTSVVCRVLCEELFMLDVTRCQVDVETNSITRIDPLMRGAIEKIITRFELLVNNNMQQQESY